MTGYDEEPIASAERPYPGLGENRVTAVMLYDEERGRAIILSERDRMTQTEAEIRRRALEDAMKAIVPPAVPVEWMERDSWLSELQALKDARDRVRALLPDAHP